LAFHKKRKGSMGIRYQGVLPTRLPRGTPKHRVLGLLGNSAPI